MTKRTRSVKLRGFVDIPRDPDLVRCLELGGAEEPPFFYQYNGKKDTTTVALPEWAADELIRVACGLGYQLVGASKARHYGKRGL